MKCVCMCVYVCEATGRQLKQLNVNSLWVKHLYCSSDSQSIMCILCVMVLVISLVGKCGAHIGGRLPHAGRKGGGDGCAHKISSRLAGLQKVKGFFAKLLKFCQVACGLDINISPLSSLATAWTIIHRHLFTAITWDIFTALRCSSYDVLWDY